MQKNLTIETIKTWGSCLNNDIIIKKWINELLEAKRRPKIFFCDENLHILYLKKTWILCKNPYFGEN